MFKTQHCFLVQSEIDQYSDDGTGGGPSANGTDGGPSACEYIFIS